MVLQSSLTIRADVAKVWEAIVDIERWPVWTPTILRITRLSSGEITVGSEAKVEQPKMPPAVWTVISLVPYKEFSWETRTPGMRMVATHLLESNGNETLSIDRLEISGVVGLLLAPIIRSMAQGYIDTENAGLKAFCE